MQLIRYETARKALAEAHRIDEVKSIRDKAEAMAAYARQAKDSKLIEYATEIKVRAERRCGELLARAKQDGQRKSDGRPKKQSNDATVSEPTLKAIGLTKDQSSRYQQLAAMPEKHFETAVATAKNTAGEVTTAFMLRAAKQHRPAKRVARAAPRPIASVKTISQTLLEFLSTVADELEARGLDAAAAAVAFQSEIQPSNPSLQKSVPALDFFARIHSWANPKGEA